MNKRIYLAGPMSHIPKFNFPAFHEAAYKLRAMGHEVFNPAEKDIQLYGEVIGESLTGDPKEAMERYGFNPRTTIRIDLNTIIDWADVLALLPGWTVSSGAVLEKALADYLQLEVWYLD